MTKFDPWFPLLGPQLSNAILTTSTFARISNIFTYYDIAEMLMEQGILPVEMSSIHLHVFPSSKLILEANKESETDIESALCNQLQLR